MVIIINRENQYDKKKCSLVFASFIQNRIKDLNDSLVSREQTTLLTVSEMYY